MRRHTTPVVRLCDVLALLARVYPWSVEPSAELARSLGYLGSDVRAATVVKGGYGGAVVAAALTFVAASVLTGPESAVVAAVCTLAAAVTTAHAVHRGPVLLASARRTRALGATTGLVGRAVLRMRIDPTMERAARFAARTGDGPLADSLGEHVRRAEGTPRSGFDGFAAEWGDWFPTVDRTVALLTASAAAPAEERERSLDRALSAVLDGTRERMAAFAGDIRGPATGIYAFGVLLPLALVGVLPAARVAGVPVSLSAFVVLYDFLLPATILAASGWLLLRRPVAFPPPRITRDHPDVSDRRRVELLAGVGVGAVGWVACSATVDWAGPLAALGLGGGTFLVVRYRSVKTVCDRVRAVEAGLPDALYLVGRRVSEGTAVETALERASEEVTGTTGEMLTDAVRVQRSLRVGVRAAFLGRYGALSDVPSDRARGTAGLLALAATQGKPAGSAIVATADQLESLRRVEREARRELSAITGTLANTAALFAPLVGGATVTLADRMADADVGRGMAGPTTPLGTEGGALTASALGPAVGVYVLLLAVLLTVLAVGVERGLDRALVGYRVGLALLAATTTYLTSTVAASLLL